MKIISASFTLLFLVVQGVHAQNPSFFLTDTAYVCRVVNGQTVNRIFVSGGTYFEQWFSKGNTSQSSRVLVGKWSLEGSNAAADSIRFVAEHMYAGGTNWIAVTQSRDSELFSKLKDAKASFGSSTKDYRNGNEIYMECDERAQFSEAMKARAIDASADAAKSIAANKDPKNAWKRSELSLPRGRDGSAQIEGAIERGRPQYFNLHAIKGQRFNLSVESPKSDVKVGVYPAGAGALLDEQVMPPRLVTGPELHTKAVFVADEAGTYVIAVGTKNSQTAYRLRISASGSDIARHQASTEPRANAIKAMLEWEQLILRMESSSRACQSLAKVHEKHFIQTHNTLRKVDNNQQNFGSRGVLSSQYNGIAGVARNFMNGARGACKL